MVRVTLTYIFVHIFSLLLFLLVLTLYTEFKSPLFRVITMQLFLILTADFMVFPFVKFRYPSKTLDLHCHNGYSGFVGTL